MTAATIRRLRVGILWDDILTTPSPVSGAASCRSTIAARSNLISPDVW